MLYGSGQHTVCSMLLRVGREQEVKGAGLEAETDGTKGWPRNKEVITKGGQGLGSPVPLGMQTAPDSLGR